MKRIENHFDGAERSGMTAGTTGRPFGGVTTRRTPVAGVRGPVGGTSAAGRDRLSKANVFVRLESHTRRTSGPSADTGREAVSVSPGARVNFPDQSSGAYLDSTSPSRRAGSPTRFS